MIGMVWLNEWVWGKCRQALESISCSVETVYKVDHKSDPCNLDLSERKNIRTRVITSPYQSACEI